MDGEESTSKEVKRHQFDFDSGTDNVYTPPDMTQNGANNSMYQRSTPDPNSAAQPSRPSAIDTILNEKKPTAVVGGGLVPPGDDEDDDEDYEEDDYEEDYDDDDK